MPRKTLVGVAERRCGSPRHASAPTRWRELLETLGVDRDRERRGPHRAAVGEVDDVAVGLVTDSLAHQPHEVGGAAGHLEADQVGAEKALEDLAAPGQLREQLGRRERDVEVEADAQVGPQLAQHPRHQLELVVVDPDRGALLGDLRRLVGEPAVDRRRRCPTTRGGTPAWRPRRGRSATESRWTCPRRTPRPPPPSAGSGPARGRRPRRARRRPRCRPASRSRRRCCARITGSRAVTKPPGERRQPRLPSGSSTRSTGSRLATMTSWWGSDTRHPSRRPAVGQQSRAAVAAARPTRRGE